MDETSFHSWLKKAKTWAKKDVQVNHIQRHRRFKGVTVYGAIGHCLKNHVFMTATSTNKEDFKKFMQKVFDNLKIGISLPIVVMDNHSAHKSLMS